MKFVYRLMVLMFYEVKVMINLILGIWVLNELKNVIFKWKLMKGVKF